MTMGAHFAWKDNTDINKTNILFINISYKAM